MLCRTAPGTPMGELLRRFWLPVALSRELPKPDCAPVRLPILTENLIAFRDTKEKVGLRARYCPHRGASLFFGRNEAGGLRCVYHGWKFDVTGACVDMPNEPAECSFKHKIHQIAYPTREAGGVIWAYMGPQASMPELPQLEWTLVPQNQVYPHKRFQHWVTPMMLIEYGMSKSAALTRGRAAICGLTVVHPSDHFLLERRLYCGRFA